MDLPTLSITIECSYWFNIARPYSHKTLEHEFALIVKKKPANQNTELNKYSVLIEQFWSKSKKKKMFMTMRPDLIIRCNYWTNKQKIFPLQFSQSINLYPLFLLFTNSF
jgi:hypothetical protein